MTQTVFNRYEKKYLMTGPVYHALRARLAPHMQEDEYGLHTICNLYYDTDDSTLIRRSIEKPPYKEKLRIRSYGVPKEDGKVFLEIKKKYRKVVNKRRIALPLTDAIALANTGKLPSRIFFDNAALAEDPDRVRFETVQILKELINFVKRYPLSRQTFLAYDRMALFGIHDGFRVTFDQNIRYRTKLVNPCLGDFGTQLLPADCYLMETKVMGATPKWFSEILSEMQIYPTSFSKYGNVYRKEIADFQYMDQMTHRIDNWKEIASCSQVYSTQVRFPSFTSHSHSLSRSYAAS